MLSVDAGLEYREKHVPHGDAGVGEDKLGPRMGALLAAARGSAPWLGAVPTDSGW
jgi:hypothetical protein